MAPGFASERALRYKHLIEVEPGGLLESTGGVLDLEISRPVEHAGWRAALVVEVRALREDMRSGTSDLTAQVERRAALAAERVVGLARMQASLEPVEREFL